MKYYLQIHSFSTPSEDFVNCLQWVKEYYDLGIYNFMYV